MRHRLKRCWAERGLNHKQRLLLDDLAWQSDQFKGMLKKIARACLTSEEFMRTLKVPRGIKAGLRPELDVQSARFSARIKACVDASIPEEAITLAMRIPDRTKMWIEENEEGKGGYDVIVNIQ